MKRFRHDDLAGEQIAKVWHNIAGIISLIAAASGIGISLTAGIGYYWHRWAAKQHQIEIDRLKENCNDSI